MGEVLCDNESNLDLFLRASVAEDISDCVLIGMFQVLKESHQVHYLLNMLVSNVTDIIYISSPCNKEKTKLWKPMASPQISVNEIF